MRRLVTMRISVVWVGPMPIRISVHVAMWVGQHLVLVDVSVSHDLVTKLLEAAQAQRKGTLRAASFTQTMTPTTRNAGIGQGAR
mmetsp:Transcript_31775/g.87793  ORF Transcript_31775/g.87793 Transcript_31775/m.87793 type:complete len:84 (-) Transcript_31775:355-606(-)